MDSIKESAKGNMIKICFVSGIIAAVLGFAPLLISWFVGLRFFVWVFALISLAAAVLAVVQKEDYNKGIVFFGAGIVLSILSLLVPTMFKVTYYAQVGNEAMSLMTDVYKSNDLEKTQQMIKKVDGNSSKNNNNINIGF